MYSHEPNPYCAPTSRSGPAASLTIGQLPSLLAVLLSAVGLMFGGVFSPPALCLAVVGLTTPARRQALLGMGMAALGMSLYAAQWSAVYRSVLHCGKEMSLVLPAWLG